MAVTAAAAAATVLTAGALTACGSSPGSPPSGVSLAGAAASVPASAPRTLSETGSSLMAPLFTLWAPAYHARFSQVTLHTVSSSSGAGIASDAQIARIKG